MPFSSSILEFQHKALIFIRVQSSSEAATRHNIRDLPLGGGGRPVHWPSLPEASCWLFNPAGPAHLQQAADSQLPLCQRREAGLETAGALVVHPGQGRGREGRGREETRNRGAADAKCKEERHEEETGVWQEEVMKRAGVWKTLLERGAVAWKTNPSCFNRCRLSAECWTRCLHPYSQTSVNFFFFLASLSHKLRWRGAL